MLKKDLISSRKICNFTVDYYITFDSSTVDEPGSLYGIAIEKHEGAENETFNASCCFTKYLPAYALIEKLSRHGVTPVGAEETIEVILEDFSP